jgi:hypothetical protein
MKNYFTVLYNLLNDKLISSFFAYREENTEENFSILLKEMYDKNAQDDFSAYLSDAILYDVNAFSRASASSSPSPFVFNAFVKDLQAIRSAISCTATRGMFSLGDKLQTIGSSAEKYAENLQSYYKQYGYGNFIRYRAFTFENNDLTPVYSPSGIQLSDLKNYEEEKKIVSSNLENFLAGLPHSNMLLYGERGTGKSSTIHAMLNRYYEDGLRLVELSKENMLQLGKLKATLRAVPLKFIVYIDDLSMNAGDERISSLKAALEGCLEGNTDNAMIVATSNRRHIVNEKFSEREDSVHAGDSEEEELSLSDRFGISVLFSTTDKGQYLSIVRQLAADRALALPDDELCSLAERWAITKGGRSPRRAKQFIDLAYSLTKRGLPVTF